MNDPAGFFLEEKSRSKQGKPSDQTECHCLKKMRACIPKTNDCAVYNSLPQASTYNQKVAGLAVASFWP